MEEWPTFLELNDFVLHCGVREGVISTLTRSAANLFFLSRARAYQIIPATCSLLALPAEAPGRRLRFHPFSTPASLQVRTATAPRHASEGRATARLRSRADPALKITRSCGSEPPMSTSLYFLPGSSPVAAICRLSIGPRELIDTLACAAELFLPGGTNSRCSASAAKPSGFRFEVPCQRWFRSAHIPAPAATGRLESWRRPGW